MTSAPPPPSIVSLPAPVVIVLADDEPVTMRLWAADRMLASTFWKLETVTVSPVVSSVPGATLRSMRVVPPEALRIRVLTPVPPSIEISEP